MSFDNNGPNPAKTKHRVMNSQEMRQTYLGETTGGFSNNDTGIGDEYRNVHTVVTGVTGSGKSQCTAHVVLQDYLKGYGGCAIGVKGDFINEILSKIPEDRLDDVIVINPRYSPALNVLEPIAADRLPDEILSTQKEVITDELIRMFKRRSENWGDRFGHVLEVLLQAHLELNIEHGERNTLIDVYQCVRDNDRVERVKAKVDNPMLKQDLEFVQNLSQSDLQPLAYRMRKFVGNDTIRPMIAAEESAIDFREAVDEGKLILVEIQKGELGGEVAQITASIVLSKIWSAIQSRIVQPPEDRTFFGLYVDEFQNYGSEDTVLSTMISEGREYKLGCWLVTQLLNREEISTAFRETILTNCQSKLVFRAEGKDARTLGQSLNGVESERLTMLNSYTAFLQTPEEDGQAGARKIRTFPPFEALRSRDEVAELKRELAERLRRDGSDTSETSDQDVESDEVAEEVEESGDSITAGSEYHDFFLEATKRRLEQRPDVDVMSKEKQARGASVQDGTVFYTDGPKAYVEVELSSLSKPVKVLRNLKRAYEAGVKCVFAVEEGKRDRLESIVEDPVNRSGDRHEDDDGTFAYYRGEDGEFTDIEFVEDAEYEVIEISMTEVEELKIGYEDQCPMLEHRPREKLENYCTARTENGNCAERSGRPCVIPKQ